jgi:hypothetical protein
MEKMKFEHYIAPNPPFKNSLNGETHGIPDVFNKE